MRAGVQNVSVELADSLDELENVALGVGQILVDMANGMAEVEGSRREALIVLGFALQHSVEVVKKAAGEIAE